jgi:hypothetical protein
MGPTAESIVVASILPKDWMCVPLEDLENTQLNTSIVNFLRSFLCEDVQEFMLENKNICRDAHCMWILLKSFVDSILDEDESDDEEEDEIEECCTTSTITTKHQASTLEMEEGERRKEPAPLEGAVKPPSQGGLTALSRGSKYSCVKETSQAPNSSSQVFEVSETHYGEDACLKTKKKKKKNNKKRRTKEGKIEKDEDSSSIEKQLEILRSEHASLVCEYES